MSAKQLNGSHVIDIAKTCAKLTAALVGIETSVNLLIHHRYDLESEEREQHLRTATDAQGKIKAVLPTAARFFAPLEGETPRQWAYHLFRCVDRLVADAHFFADPACDRLLLTAKNQRCDKLLRFIGKKLDRVNAGSAVVGLADPSPKQIVRRRRKQDGPARPTNRQKEIADAVVQYQGNRTKASLALGISRQEVGQQLKVYIGKMERQNPTVAKQFKESIRKPKGPKTKRHAHDKRGQVFIPRTDRRRRTKPIRDDEME